MGGRDLFARRVSRLLSVIGGSEIFLIFGPCADWAEFRDFRRVVALQSIRYASMIVPFLLRGGEESALRTPRTSTDTALTGDPWASSWAAYSTCGIQSRQFDPIASSAEVRTLQDCYRLFRQVCMGDPVGIVQTLPIPNTVGKVTAITTAWGAQYSRHSHLPLFNVDSLYGLSIGRPGCLAKGLQHTPAAKIVIVGGHLGVMGDGVTMAKCEWATPRVYPIGIVRHILRETQNHSQVNLPPASVLGIAWGNPDANAASHTGSGPPPRVLGHIRMGGKDVRLIPLWSNIFLFGRF